MLHMLHLGSFKVLTTLLFWSQNSWQLSLLELPSLLLLEIPHVTSSSDSSSWYTSTAQFGPSGPLLVMQPLRPILAFKPLIFFLPTLKFPHCTLATALCSWLLAVSLYLLLPLPFLTPSGFFNGMLGVS